uniref:Uncharacterized protein n=1 Tax=Fagus sylvatica TaxID=28930 RepID=A0A2N9IDT5_FAGSY
MHDVELPDRQDSPSLAGIFTGRMPSNGPKTPRRPLLAGPYLSSPGSVSRKSRTLQEKVAQAFQQYQECRNPTSGARSNMRANTDKKQGKMSRRFDTFFSRTAAFARRVFPTRCKLTHEPRCVGNMTTPATTCNSRFACGFPRLAGIFTENTHKNSSGTPTSGSHNSLVQTPIRANFIPGPRSGQKRLDQTYVKLGQLWSNLVNPSQTWSTSGKCAPNTILRLFDVASPRRIRPAWFGLPLFACRHPRKSRGSDLALRKSIRPSEVRRHVRAFGGGRNFEKYGLNLGFTQTWVWGKLGFETCPNLNLERFDGLEILSPNRCLTDAVVAEVIAGPHAFGFFSPFLGLSPMVALPCGPFLRDFGFVRFRRYASSIEVVVALSAGSECTCIPYFRIPYSRASISSSDLGDSARGVHSPG